MNKLELKKSLIELEKMAIKESAMSYSDFLSDTQLKYGDVIDFDDKSRYKTTEQVSDQLDSQVHEHEEHLNTIEKLTFEPTETVRPGAVVKVNGRYFIVAVAKPCFKLGGKHYMGISTSAPIYECLSGKRSGDSFQFNGQTFMIEEVY